MTKNVCNLFYDIAQGNKTQKEVSDFVIGPSYEMDDAVFKREVYDVAVNYGIKPDEVNAKVASQIMQLQEEFVAQRNALLPDPSAVNFQKTYSKTLEDVALIVRNLKTRVDYLSEFGLGNVVEAEQLKKLGVVGHGIGQATAPRIITLIKYKGNVGWKAVKGKKTLKFVIKGSG